MLLLCWNDNWNGEVSESETLSWVSHLSRSALAAVRQFGSLSCFILVLQVQSVYIYMLNCSTPCAGGLKQNNLCRACTYCICVFVVYFTEVDKWKQHSVRIKQVLQDISPVDFVSALTLILSKLRCDSVLIICSEGDPFLLISGEDFPLFLRGKTLFFHYIQWLSFTTICPSFV